MPARIIALLIAPLLGFALAAGPAGAEPVTVFAAASLKTALDRIAEAWQAETGNKAVISYGGTPTLARQIELGAPADIFVSASADWMDVLEDGGHVQAETRRDLLGNTLVLVGHGRDAARIEIGPGLDLAGMLGDRRLAMALVDSVPAGVYGKAALTSLGLWEAVSPKVAQADNVRAAMALVSAGEAPLGIVYRTDAGADDNVSVLGTFPPDTHPPIVYPAALTTESADGAAVFLDYLSGDTARAVFEAEGFEVLSE